MKKIENNKVLELLEGARERRDLEFKQPFKWKDGKSWIEECFIRALLALSNTRLGGTVVVGIEEDKAKKIIYSGLSEEELNSFEDYDKIKGQVDKFSYTPIEFEMSRGEYLGKSFLVVTVTEFEETPVICKKDGEKHGNDERVLIANTIYARMKKGPASSSRATDAELREIIRLAADKERSQLKERKYVYDPDQSNPFDDQIKDIYER